MDKVYQVFVSSTFSDLKEERQQVSNTLAKAGYVAAGMELFPATDQQQLEYIKRVIDRSDYYVVIVGGRYGSLADETMSYTEKEFEYATLKNMPVLAFLHGDPRKLSVDRTDEDPKKAKLLQKFRTKLSTGRIVEFWTDANELCAKVVIAVANAVNLTPGVGWVRGNHAIDPSVLQESERLRIENETLRQRLAAHDGGALVFDDTLLGPTDSMVIKGTVNLSPTRTEELTLKRTFGELFDSLYDVLLTEPDESRMRTEIRTYLERAFKGEYRDHQFVDVKDTYVKLLGTQFEALGLIRITNFGTDQGWGSLQWQITDKGRRFAISNRALRR